MPRDGSPLATARRPCMRQRSESRAGSSRSRPSGGGPSASAACRMSSWSSQASASAHRIWTCVVAAQPRLLQRARQQRGGIGAVPVLERLDRLGVEVRRRTRRAVYLVYTRNASALRANSTTRQLSTPKQRGLGVALGSTSRTSQPDVRDSGSSMASRSASIRRRQIRTFGSWELAALGVDRDARLQPRCAYLYVEHLVYKLRAQEVRRHDAREAGSARRRRRRRRSCG